MYEAAIFQLKKINNLERLVQSLLKTIDNKEEK